MAELQPSEKKGILILAVGVTPALQSELTKTFASAKFTELPFDMEKLIEPLDVPPSVILVSSPPPEISPTEIAQLFRGIYPNASSYYLGEFGKAMDRKILIKNGFSDAFFFPIEKQNFFQALKETLALLGSQDRAFRNVKLLDVTPGTTLDFNTYLYLPANNKHIRYSSSGEALDGDRIARLKNHSVKTLSVPVEEMKNFYAYAANSLVQTNNSKMSETERAEKMEGSVRELITSLFSGTNTSTEQGKVAVADLQNIVKKFITDSPGTNTGLYSRLLAVSAQLGNNYSRSSAMSTYASLFALGTGVKEIHDIAIAGLLADLGLSKIPQEILSTPKENWLDADRATYETHPERSVDIIKERKLILSETIYKIVLQHHEAYNGTGFPRKLVGDRIHIGAQLLAIADHLIDLTEPVPGKPQLSPKQALDQMLDEMIKNPGLKKHNPDLINRIKALFQESPASS